MNRTSLLPIQRMRLDNGYANKEYEELQSHMESTSACMDRLKREGEFDDVDVAEA